MFRPFQRRFRRSLRKSQEQFGDLSLQAEQGLERNLLRRYERLSLVKRFVAGWIALFVLLLGCVVWQLLNLSSYYQSIRPVPGGIYNEGLQGTFTTANPLYASNAVDSTVSHLVFAGLFKYDDKNKLVGDLASDYSSDPGGKVYTVHLKPGLTWQDGHSLTSADVVFTYQAIQNPDAQSPLLAGWQGVKLSAPDAHTIVFTLPNALASFPDNLTNGIVPAHLLAKTPISDLRTADFNTQSPVGAGPFRWQAVQVSGGGPSDAQQQIALVPFKHYAGGAPKLQQFVVHAFANPKQLTDAFKTGQLTAVAGLDRVPANYMNDQSITTHSLLLTAGTYVFFNNSEGVLADAKVRQALVQGSDPEAIIKQLGYATREVKEPLLQGQLGYDPAYEQATDNLTAAKALLDQDGWKVGAKGVRYKDGRALSFELSAANNSENWMVVRRLQQQWQALGVKLQPLFQSHDDFAASLTDHSSYNAVLYGISIGSDPDVFAYWDSSQAGVLSPTHLNLSEYKSSAADSGLEGGRTRLDPTLRAVKYKSFLQAWQQDAPALGLYQPRYLYLTHGTVYNLTDHQLNVGADRLNNVQNWEVRTAKVTNP